MRGSAVNKPVNFTDRFLAAAKKPQVGRTVVRDAAVRGLGLKVEASGRKTFFWSRRTGAKRVQYETLGVLGEITLEQARTKASEINANIGKWKLGGKHGPSPLDTLPALKLEQVFEAYIAARTAEGADPRARRWVFKRYLATIAAKPLSAITHEELDALHTHIGATYGRAIARRALKLVNTVYRYALKKRTFKGDNPATGIEYSEGNERERFLAPEEMARLLAALDDEPSVDLRDWVMLALLTGVRKSNIFQMRWQDVLADANRRAFWHVTKTKTGKDYDVVLVDAALKILARRRKARVADDPWVFPSHGPSGHVVSLQKRWEALRKRAKLTDFHQHDCRRSLGSWMTANNTSLTIVGKALGHESLASTQIYARLNLDPVRGPVERATALMLATKKKN
jgi:integrase